MFMVTAETARKWADRYRTEGVTGMTDRGNRLSRIDVTKFGTIPDEKANTAVGVLHRALT